MGDCRAEPHSSLLIISQEPDNEGGLDVRTRDRYEKRFDTRECAKDNAGVCRSHDNRKPATAVL